MTVAALLRQEGGSHYKNMVIQPVEFITKNNIGFLEGCVIKRVCRWKNKDGLQDLRKAIHELELLIQQEEQRLAQVRGTGKVAAGVDLPKLAINPNATAAAAAVATGWVGGGMVVQGNSLKPGDVHWGMSSLAVRNLTDKPGIGKYPSEDSGVESA